MFEISSEEIKELMEAKVLLGKFDKFLVRAYWYDKSKNIELLGLDKVPLTVRIFLKELFERKASIVWGGSISEWLDGYEYIDKKDKWFTYEDTSGVKDNVEVKIKTTELKTQIIEKRPTGTLRTTYFYEREKWAQNKRVLKKIKKTIYEGNQSIEINSSLRYKLYDGVFWMPSKLSVGALQKINLGGNEKVERKINEHYLFSHYKINQQEALKWFTKQK